MPFTLDHVLIWGRSFDEYEKMFALKQYDYNKKILGCADGAASFNRRATAMGVEVISCDPLYEKKENKIRERIERSCEIIYPKILNSIDDFNWEYFKTPVELRDHRLTAANEFLRDFAKNKANGRYVASKLPILPFADNEFDLALCGNFLFLYSEILTVEFHIQSIIELLRVAKEVRIFPLIGNNRETPTQLQAVLNVLDKCSVVYDIVTVNYHFTVGANQMLRIIKE